MKVSLHTFDPMLTLVRTKEEYVDLFGEEGFEEEAYEVPDELAKEADEVYNKMIEISRKLARIKRAKDHEFWCTKTSNCSGCKEKV